MTYFLTVEVQDKHNIGTPLSALFKLVVCLPIGLLKFLYFVLDFFSLFAKNEVFLRDFWFEKRVSIKEVSRKSIYSSVCMQTPIVIFLLNPTVHSLQKNVADYITHIFDFFFSFSQKLSPLKSEFLVSINSTVLKIFPL